jgi:hypothetical protein
VWRGGKVCLKRDGLTNELLARPAWLCIKFEVKSSLSLIVRTIVTLDLRKKHILDILILKIKVIDTNPNLKFRSRWLEMLRVIFDGQAVSGRFSSGLQLRGYAKFDIQDHRSPVTSHRSPSVKDWNHIYIPYMCTEQWSRHCTTECEEMPFRGKAPTFMDPIPGLIQVKRRSPR